MGRGGADGEGEEEGVWEGGVGLCTRWESVTFLRRWSREVIEATAIGMDWGLARERDGHGFVCACTDTGTNVHTWKYMCIAH